MHTSYLIYRGRLPFVEPFLNFFDSILDVVNPHSSTGGYSIHDVHTLITSYKLSPIYKVDSLAQVTTYHKVMAHFITFRAFRSTYCLFVAILQIFRSWRTAPVKHSLGTPTCRVSSVCDKSPWINSRVKSAKEILTLFWGEEGRGWGISPSPHPRGSAGASSHHQSHQSHRCFIIPLIFSAQSHRQLLLTSSLFHFRK